MKLPPWPGSLSRVEGQSAWRKNYFKLEICEYLLIPSETIFQLGRFYIQVYVMYGLTMLGAHQTDVQVFILKYIEYITLFHERSLPVHNCHVWTAGLTSSATKPAEKIYQLKPKQYANTYNMFNSEKGVNFSSLLGGSEWCMMDHHFYS
jgi:hypothetical protein